MEEPHSELESECSLCWLRRKSHFLRSPGEKDSEALMFNNTREDSFIDQIVAEQLSESFDVLCIWCLEDGKTQPAMIRCTNCFSPLCTQHQEIYSVVEDHTSPNVSDQDDEDGTSEDNGESGNDYSKDWTYLKQLDNDILDQAEEIQTLCAKLFATEKSIKRKISERATKVEELRHHIDEELARRIAELTQETEHKKAELDSYIVVVTDNATSRGQDSSTNKRRRLDNSQSDSTIVISNVPGLAANKNTIKDNQPVEIHLGAGHAQGEILKTLTDTNLRIDRWSIDIPRGPRDCTLLLLAVLGQDEGCHVFQGMGAQFSSESAKMKPLRKMTVPNLNCIIVRTKWLSNNHFPTWPLAMGPTFTLHLDTAKLLKKLATHRLKTKKREYQIDCSKIKGEI